MALLGGTAPMIATWLIVQTGNEMSPAFFLMAAALISGFVVLGIRETAHEPLG
jgi:MHS family proline/betaine transporter-like MFS transporter